MIQAKSQQGIAKQPVRFDGVVANFTNAKGSAVQAGESFIHAVDELPERGVGNARAGSCLQAGPAPLEFRVQVRMSRGIHVCHAESLLLCAWGIHPFCASKFERFRRGKGKSKKDYRTLPPATARFTSNGAWVVALLLFMRCRSRSTRHI